MNTFAKALKVIGTLTIIAGVAVGIMQGQHEVVYDKYFTKNEMNAVILVTYIVAGTVSGIVLMGLGEVINLLQKLNDNNQPKINSQEMVH